MWRIRQINLIKYVHECEHSSHISSNLLGSEQLQNINEKIKACAMLTQALIISWVKKLSPVVTQWLKVTISRLFRRTSSNWYKISGDSQKNKEHLLIKITG
jgi:hypothetical protein